MNVNDILSSKWIKASHLSGDTDVTITKFSSEGTYNDGKAAYGIALAEFPGKMLGLNSTNTKTIAKIHGDDTDRWIGKKITIYPTEVENRGEMVMGIRVRLRAPAGPATPAGSAEFSTPPLDLTFGAKGKAWLDSELAKHPTDPAGMLGALRQHLTVKAPSLASVAAGPVEGWPKVWKPIVIAWLTESEEIPF